MTATTHPPEQPGGTAPSVLRNHFPQLDGLRALAAIAVISEHFTRLETWTRLPVGIFGLWLFFVLSGFLITGILLRSKADAAGDWGELTHAWRAFYMRRILRIFPLYYTVLGIAILVGLPGIRQNIGWNAFHLANVPEVTRGQAPGFGHFWSLSVEEQFYFVWPTIVLLAPRRFIYVVASAMILVAPVSRLAMLTVSDNFHLARVAPPSCLDGLGMGALLGLLRDGGGTSAAWRTVFGRVALGVGLAILGAVFAASLVGIGWRLPFSARYSGFALVAFWLIDRAADGFGGITRAVLESRPLLYLGKISFGIYVLHLIVPEGIKWLEIRTGVSLGFPTELGWGQFAYVTAVSVVLATISWSILERPINDLKRFFPYSSRKSRAERAERATPNPELAPLASRP